MNIKRLTVINSILITVAFIGIGFVYADQKTVEFIGQLKKKAEAVNSYRADLVDIQMMGGQTVSKTKIIFKKPNKSWEETISKTDDIESKYIEVFNGKIRWVYDFWTKVAHKLDLEKINAATGIEPPRNETQIGMPRDISDISSAEKARPGTYSYILTEKIDGKEVYLFESNSSTMQNIPSSKMQLWFGVEDGLIRKMVMLKGEKEAWSQVYKNIEINIEVPDSQFDFTPPEGAKIVDGTESMIRELMRNRPGVPYLPK